MMRLPLTALLALASVHAASPASDELAAHLARMPRPWSERMHRLTLEEYKATMHFWAESHPRIATLEERGHSTGGLPLYLLKITDPAVPAADKQVCLVTSLHGGPERSGTTTGLRLTEWLLGDSPEAIEIRRKQIVLLMPITNPYGFFVSDRFGNEQKIDIYNAGSKWWDLDHLRLVDPKKTPEIAAILSVMDQYQPEVHADLHGTGLQAIPLSKLGDRTMYRGQTMWVESGSAISNFALRPWDPRINETIDNVARAAGYGLDRNEADGQRVFWGPDLAPIADRVWTGRPLFYTAHYSYAKYHTMMVTMEMGWEDSGLARMRGLFRIGNGTWLDEDQPGYPVDKLRSYLSGFVTSYGATAAERRASRVELWNKQGGFAIADLYPQTDGHGLWICAVTPEAIATLDEDPAVFLRRLPRLLPVGADLVRQFMAAGPELIFAIQPKTPSHPAVASVEHGIGLRMRIPYRHPELLDIRVNGELLREDRRDGYHTWYADGWTELQINLPPAKARAMPLFIVTYAYKPDVVRTYGFDPPPEATARLKSGK